MKLVVTAFMEKFFVDRLKKTGGLEVVNDYGKEREFMSFDVWGDVPARNVIMKDYNPVKITIEIEEK